MALKNGAAHKEVMEASWMAVMMGGGPALMYMQLVEEALKEFEA
jgi:alkylhydroperoxidase/carboxymuconolactone decarboxylase family protein YurZ